MALNNTVRAILLDLDGTLADSLSVMQLAYRQFLSQFRREPSELEFASLNGPPLTEVVRRLKSLHALDQDEATLLSNYFEIIDATYSEVKPSFGAGDLLQAAKNNNCTVGIVTSNTKKRTQRRRKNYAPPQTHMGDTCTHTLYT